MDHQTLLLNLVRAERNVAQGQAHLARQEALLAALDRGGHNTSHAKAVLERMRAIQQVHLQDVNRIRGELKGYPRQ